MRVQSQELTKVCSNLLVREAQRWVGMTEEGGNNKGQFVNRVQDAVSRDDEDLPWCADFVIFCLHAVMWQLECMYGVNIRDRVQYTVPDTASVMNLWKKTEFKYKIMPNEYRDVDNLHGSLVVWQRGDSGAYGHIGIVESQFAQPPYIHDPCWFRSVEGNSLDDKGKKQGVFTHAHSIKGDKLLGFIDPFVLNL